MNFRNPWHTHTYSYIWVYKTLQIGFKIKYISQIYFYQEYEDIQILQGVSLISESLLKGKKHINTSM